MKALLAHDTLIEYPNSNYPLMYTLMPVNINWAQWYCNLVNQLLSIFASLHQLSVITPPWRKNFFLLLKPWMSFTPCSLGSQEPNIRISLMQNLPRNEFSVGDCTLWNTIPNATISKDPIMHSLMPWGGFQLVRGRACKPHLWPHHYVLQRSTCLALPMKGWSCRSCFEVL